MELNSSDVVRKVVPEGSPQCVPIEQTGVNLEILDIQNIQKQASFAGNDAANDDGDTASILSDRSSSTLAMRAMISQKVIDYTEDSGQRASLLSQRGSNDDLIS